MTESLRLLEYTLINGHQDQAEFQYYFTVACASPLVVILCVIVYILRYPKLLYRESPLSSSLNDKTRTFQDFFFENMPMIFRANTSLINYYAISLEKHHFYSLFSSNDSETHFKLDHLVSLLLHFNALFIVSIVMVNDMYEFECTNYKDSFDCETQKNMFEWFKMCEWNKVDNICSPMESVPTSREGLNGIIIISLCCAIGANVLQGILHSAVKTANNFILASKEASKVFPERDIEESKQSVTLSEFDDEFCKFQSRKGVMLKAVRCQLMHQSIDFVPPKKELQELLNPNSKVRAWKQSPVSFDGSINICNFMKYQFQVWKNYYYSIGNPDLAFEAVNQLRIHRQDILVQRIRESRKRAEEMRFHLVEPTLTDRDRDSLLFRYFLSDWFSGCDQLVAKRLLIDEIVHIPKRLDLYSPFIVHKIVLFFFGIVLLTSLTILGSMLIRGSLASASCLISVGLAHGLYAVVILPLRILFSELLIPQIIRNKLLTLFKVLECRLKYIAKRETGLLHRVQSLIQHYHPACRTARLLPWLPMSRILIALHDFDLPTSTYKEWKPTYRVLSSNTGSPLVVDFLEVVAHNWSVRLFYAFFRILHYLLMVIKFALNLLLLLHKGLRDMIMDICLSICVYGVILLIMTQKIPSAVTIVPVFVMVFMLVSGIIHSFQWYGWYPYIRVLWDNDWFSPKRKSYIRKKPKNTKIVIAKPA